MRRAGPGAGKGRIVAVFDEGEHVALVASTLAAAKAGKLSRGARGDLLWGRAERLGGGLWMRPTGPDKPLLLPG